MIGRRIFHLIFFLIVSFILSLASNSQAAYDRTYLYSGNVKQPASIFPKTIGQIGGSSRALAHQGDYVYLALGMRMVILNVANPNAPVIVGKTHVLPGSIAGISVSNNRAYLVGTELGGLLIFDVSNPASPEKIGQAEIYNFPLDIVVSGNTAYIAQYDGMIIFDVANPANPQVKGSISGMNYIQGITVSGNHAYLPASIMGVYMVNLTNLAKPTITRLYDTPNHAWDAVADGSYLYIIDDWTLRVVNISTPSSASQIGSLSLPQLSWAPPWLITKAGNMVYIGGNELFCINVVQAGLPVKVGHINRQAEAFVYGNNHIFSAQYDGGMDILNVASPDNPFLAGEYISLGSPRSIDVQNNTLLVNDWSYLHILDVTNPSSVVELARYTSPSVSDKSIWDLEIFGNYAYLAYPNSGIGIVNITNPANPIETKFFFNNGATSLVVRGNYLYAINWNLFYIVDISNPTSPVQKGSCSINWDSSNGGLHLVVSGNYAYIASGSFGVQVVDVSNVMNPQAVSSFNTPGRAVKVAISGDFAYVADESSGMRILNINNPLAITEAGYFLPNSYYSSVSDVAIFSHFALLTDWYNGLFVIDVANPTNLVTLPTEQGYDPYYANNIVVEGEYAYVGWDEKGLVNLYLVSLYPEVYLPLLRR